MDSEDFFKWLLPIFVGAAVRSIVMLYPHSGEHKAPLYGDYEAQRHWMEITTNLPSSQWYHNSTQNDLNYWGLDYPPLTAYHSWIMGKVSERFDLSWTTLLSSRGTETYDHKIFMRHSVLCSDLLVFIPALLYFFHSAVPHITKNPDVPAFYSCLISLLYPGLILIDHGHFQYNCVSLGLFIAAVGLLLAERDILGSMFFCLSLGYKQMELYHSLPIFFYLLGRCLRLPLGEAFQKLTALSMTVIITFIIIFLPFLHSRESLYQVFHRLFPLARGLYEDKVSNFWCATSPLVKWASMMSQRHLVYLCSTMVLLSNIPCAVALLFSPQKSKLLSSLAASSMSFFLFSYQVHEKSVLLVAIPALLLLSSDPKSSFLFSISSTLSMWPLLYKDGLGLATLCTLCLFILLCITVIFRENISTLMFGLCGIILLGYGVLILGHVCLTPPSAYPDLFPLLISMFSFVQFFAFYLYWTWQTCRNV